MALQPVLELKYSIISWRGSAIQATISILYLIAGGFIIAQPAADARPLSLLIGLSLFGIGVMRIIASQHVRAMPGSRWVMATGIIDMVLGAMLLLGWPVIALWGMGVCISVDLLVSGIAYITLSLRLNRRIPEIRA